MESAIGLDEVKRVDVKRPFHRFQDTCSAKMPKVPGIVAEAFKFAIKLDYQETFADTGPSAVLLSVKDAFATARVVAKEAKDQFVSVLIRPTVLWPLP